MSEVVRLDPDHPLPAGGEVVHVYRSGMRLVRLPDGVPVAEEAPAATGGLLLAAGAEAFAEARALGVRVVTSAEEGSGPPPQVRALLADGALLAYVALHGPVDRRLLRLLRATGLDILGPQPVHALLCRGTPEQFAEAAVLPFVREVVALTGALKPAPDLPEDGDAELVVSLTGTDPAGTADELDRLDGVTGVPGSGEPVPGGFRVRVRASAAGVTALLAHPLVLAVEGYAPVTGEDEVAGLVVAGRLDAAGHAEGDYLTWLSGHGFSGAGVAVGVVDDGVDEQHPAFAGRITALDGSTGSHGTMVAGQVAGGYMAERDPDGRAYGLGIAPDAELVSQAQGRPAAETAAETVASTGPGGAPATIQNNSWGRATTQDPLDYGSEERALDALVRNAAPVGSSPRPLTICFSVGNKGRLGMTRPKSAKNILVTGNSENDRIAAGGADADDVRDVFSGPDGSSRGNCGDGRIRPDVVAPGQWTASANHGIAPGDARYISPLVRWGGGSSAASPKVAGACAVLTQWWRWQSGGDTPSPAMLRALLVNQAVDTGSHGPVPNPYQGWGRVDLGAVLAERHERVYLDQQVLLTDPGTEHRLALAVADPGEPVRVTLVWTDPPGPLGSGRDGVPAIVNRLALRVEAAGLTYHGNTFAQGRSVASGQPPAGRGLDNVQNVFLPAGAVSGALTVAVEALDLPADAFGTDPLQPRQDFALVVDNARRTGAAGTVTVVVDSAAGGPAPADPEERWADGEDDAAYLDAERWVGRLPEDAPEETAPATAAEHAWWGRPAPGTSAEREEAGAPEVPPGLVAALVTAGAGTGGAVVAPLADAVRGAAGDVVVVIGEGTRFDTATLARLRRGALLGRVHLVTTSRAAARFAATRIGRPYGVRVHLVAAAEDVPTTVARALAESLGCQRLELVPEGGGTEFDVIDEDRRLLVVLAGTRAAKFTAPDGRTTEAGAAGTRLTSWAGGAVLTVDPAAGAWAGRWRVDPDGGRVVDVFAEGGPLLGGGAWGGRDGEVHVEVRVEGGALTSLTVARQAAHGEVSAEEATTVIPVPLGADPVVAEEGGGTVLGGDTLVATLPAVATGEESGSAGWTSPSPDAASCLVRGVDRAGRPLRRWWECTGPYRARRSEWLRAAARTVRTRARVVEVIRSRDGAITALGVDRDGVRRRVRVRDRALATALAGARLDAPSVELQVRGDDLVALTVPVPHTPGGTP